MSLSWLWAVPLLGALVLTHELGHFLVARVLGIRVMEFAIGFPPRIASFEFREVRYSLNLIPLGGYVRFSSLGADAEFDQWDPDTFVNAPIWKRAATILAGPLANVLVIPLILYIGQLAASAVYYDAPLTGVVKVHESSPAQAAGVLPGDRLVSLAGVALNSDVDLISVAQKHLREEVILVVEREGRELTLPITLTMSYPDGQPFVGVYLYFWGPYAVADAVSPGSQVYELGLRAGDRLDKVNGTQVKNLPHAVYVLFHSHKESSLSVKRGNQVYNIPASLHLPSDSMSFALPDRNVEMLTLYDQLGFMLHVPHHLGFPSVIGAWNGMITQFKNGPIGLSYSKTYQGSREGLISIVAIGIIIGRLVESGDSEAMAGLIAGVSLGLALFNLVPCPPLDGGQLALIGVEALRGGRKLPRSAEIALMILGALLVVGLTAYGMLRDLLSAMIP
ncbi:MAG TPA: site-2 protease family protein [Chloroflexia bacterium]|nr:site-2 protease family protein [Chloroflexia bacterium]